MSPCAKSPVRIPRSVAVMASPLLAGLILSGQLWAADAAAAATREIDINAAEAGPKPPPPPTSYLLRCWQYGRLIFEELDLPMQAGLQAATPKMKLLDAAGLPLFVSETKNATCLLRPHRSDPEQGSAP